MLRGAGRRAIAIRTAAFSRLLVVNKKTNELRSLFEFFNYEQFMKDVAMITDTARGKKLTMAQLGMAIMRNLRRREGARRISDLADRESV